MTAPLEVEVVPTPLMPSCGRAGLSLAGVFSVLSFFLVLGAVGFGFTAFGFASGACRGLRLTYHRLCIPAAALPLAITVLRASWRYHACLHGLPRAISSPRLRFSTWKECL